MSDLKPIHPGMPSHLQVINDWLSGLSNMEECNTAIMQLLQHIQGMLPAQKFYYTAENSSALNPNKKNYNFWEPGSSNSLIGQVGHTYDGYFCGRLGDETPLIYSNDRTDIIKQLHQELADLGYIYLGHKE